MIKNAVRMFKIDLDKENKIEYMINRYCEHHILKPISISVCLKKDSILVFLIVELSDDKI